jgi:hypothetical protein
MQSDRLDRELALHAHSVAADSGRHYGNKYSRLLTWAITFAAAIITLLPSVPREIRFHGAIAGSVVYIILVMVSAWAFAAAQGCRAIARGLELSLQIEPSACVHWSLEVRHADFFESLIVSLALLSTVIGVPVLIVTSDDRSTRAVVSASAMGILALVSALTMTRVVFYELRYRGKFAHPDMRSKAPCEVGGEAHTLAPSPEAGGVREDARGA